MFVTACERPFVEAEAPALRILAPQAETVLSADTTTLRVRASSFRPVERVEVNGEPLRLDPVGNVWVADLQLRLGLNPFVIAAFDVGGTIGVDTLHLVRLPLQRVSGPSLPELPAPRGGHAATLLNNGDLLVTGGAQQAGGLARADAYLLPAGSQTFVTLDASLQVARTGHTATLLPDGRVLIAGGSRTDALTNIDDLVETVEIYDPTTRRFTEVPFQGQPIRRALHTAALRRSDVLDLYAGRGDIRYTPSPRLGTRRDLRSFRLRSDSLIALNTLVGAPIIGDGVAGHTQTSLTTEEPGVAATYLVAGSFFGVEPPDDLSLRIDFSSPLQVIVTEAAPLRLSRIRHAAVRLQSGFVMLLGGWQDTPARLIQTPELYVAAANRYYRFPEALNPSKRYGHTATKLSSNRILLLGGFNGQGNSLASSEFLDTDFIK